MQQNATLREIASSLGIHLGTAFRWRHAILRSLVSGVSAPLSGLVEIGAIPFALNEKGRRDLGESARRRGGRSVGMVETGQARTQVIVAVSIDGGVRTEHLEDHYVRTRDALRFLDRNVAQGEPVVPAGGYWGSVIALASRQTGRYTPPRPGEPWIEASHLQSYRRRLRRWIAGFRGVGTDYLDGYLRWHQSIEAGTLDSDLETTLPTSVGERAAGP